MDINDIANRFSFHPPKEGQNDKYDEIRERIMELALFLNEMCPDSREKSLAFTNLEQVSFYSNASIARNE